MKVQEATRYAGLVAWFYDSSLTGGLLTSLSVIVTDDLRFDQLTNYVYSLLQSPQDDVGRCLK